MCNELSDCKGQCFVLGSYVDKRDIANVDPLELSRKKRFSVQQVNS